MADRSVRNRPSAARLHPRRARRRPSADTPYRVRTSSLFGSRFGDCGPERIEAELPADPLAASARWAKIGELADVLAAVVAAQQQWLADNDADLLRVIEAFRRNFAVMRDSGYTIEWEDV